MRAAAALRIIPSTADAQVLAAFHVYRIDFTRRYKVKNTVFGLSGDVAQLPDTSSAPALPSVLFHPGSQQPSSDCQSIPDFFRDLHLDQIVDSIMAGREEYDLKPFFCGPLCDIHAVNYRYDVFQNLQDGQLLEAIRDFCGQMKSMRHGLSQSEKLYYKRQKQFWFLDAVYVYCEATTQLSRSLARADLRAWGMQLIHAHLAAYTESRAFKELHAEARSLTRLLSVITYSLHISGSRILVDSFKGEPDYSKDVLETFSKFQEKAGREYKFSSRFWEDMNHVEAAILDRVALLYPELLLQLDNFCSSHAAYLDTAIARFDREVQFYLACIEQMDRLREVGLEMCFPEVIETKDIFASDAFDIALAERLARDGKAVISNDFSLTGHERILIVSGPNQGGKTTFARAFGQIHYLASIGCPVPARQARVFLGDRLYTHFERKEDIHTLRGKLEDELYRMHAIFEDITPQSILIMNESFQSTTLQDALYLNRQIMRKVVEKDLISVAVTFLDELTGSTQGAVSMVSRVNRSNPATRTFKVIRMPADGLAYANAIARKYDLTHDRVLERVAENAKRCRSL